MHTRISRTLPALISALTIISCGAGDNPGVDSEIDDGEEVPFLIIACPDVSQTSLLDEPENFIVSDEFVFSDFWSGLFPEDTKPLPEVDFGLGSLIVVYGGVRGSGNTLVEISEVKELGSSVTVSYDDYVPEFEGCGGPGVVTAPYCIVQVPTVLQTATFNAITRNPCSD